MLLPAVVFGTLAGLVLLLQETERRSGREVSYTGFLAMGSALKKATIRGNEFTGRDEQGGPFATILPADPAIATRPAERGIEVSIAATSDHANVATSLAQIVLYYGSLAILFGLLLRIAQALERGQGGR